MESINTILEKRNIHLPLRYYGADDLSVGLEIRSIVENRDLFESLYSTYPLDCVSDINSYYYYLLTRKIFRMGELVHNPDVLFSEQKDADLLAKLSDDAEAVTRKTSDSAIRYINKHAEDIFSDEKHGSELKYISVDLIIECQERINYSVFEYLCQNFRSLIIRRFGELRETFLKYQDLFTELFPSGHLDLKNPFGLQDVLDVWRHEYRTNSPFSPVLDHHVDELCNDVIETLSEHRKPGDESILQTQPVVKAVSLFLLQINGRQKERFLQFASFADYRLLQYLSAHRHFHKFRVPDRDEGFKRRKFIDPYRCKLTALTHQTGQLTVGRSFESFLEMFSEGQTADSTYDLSEKCENYLLDLGEFNAVNFLMILNDPAAYEDYIQKVMKEIQFISGSACLSDDSLQGDVSMMFGALCIMVHLMHDCDDGEREAACYGAAMFLCALTEKLLRLFYLHNPPSNSGNINPDKLTLNKILRLRDRSPMTSAFRIDHRMGLAYFLITVCNGAGRNFRNKLAHWRTDMSPGLLLPSFTSRLLWLFTDVLNSVYLYYEPVNSSQTDS